VPLPNPIEEFEHPPDPPLSLRSATDPTEPGTKPPTETATSSGGDLSTLLREGRGLAARPGRRVASELAGASTASRSSGHSAGRRSAGSRHEPRYDTRFIDDEYRDHPEYAGPPRGRPTASLQRTWVDPEEMPFTPVARPGSPLVSRMLSVSVSLMFVALLAWLIIPEVSYRINTSGTVKLRGGVLTAQPVQLSPSSPAVVKELFIDASQLPDGQLPKGTAIAALESVSRDGSRLQTDILRTPFDARFASVDVLEGGVTFPGAPVATVYDPLRMYVILTVQPHTLDVLRRGMRATLKSPVLDKTIPGTVISAVPLLGTDHNPTTAKLVNIRIKPDVEIKELVPGVRFDAVIDLGSAPKDAPQLVFTIEDPGALPGGSGAPNQSVPNQSPPTPVGAQPNGAPNGSSNGSPTGAGQPTVPSAPVAATPSSVASQTR
jgi:hypothetical protein